tara:strand:- start:58224 stop:59786 length:1563 start_codon:yes stop_codon:yes gene_type:complete
MKFFSLSELKNNISSGLDSHESDFFKALRKEYARLFESSPGLKIDDREVTEQELFFLIDLYEKEENQVFSSWVEADETLLSFLKNKRIRKIKPVDLHEGHLLQEKYQVFLGHFLYSELTHKVKEAIETEDLFSMVLYTELSKILTEKKRIDVQRPFQEYIEGALKSNNKLVFSEEFIGLLNLLDDNYYSLKISYVDYIKTKVKKDNELWGEGIKRLKQLKLHKQHKVEVANLINTLSEKPNKNSSIRVFQLLRTPLFYAGLLIIAVLVYILIPKEAVKPPIKSGVPQNRTGLDSLTLAEIEGTDTLLGYKEDSVLQDLEKFAPPPDVVDAFQVVDGEDTLKNQLVKALTRSMVADYNIQDKQQDSESCNSLSISEKEGFQMKGVLDLDDFYGGFDHLLINKTEYDLYIILFENESSGDAYGSFVPANGKIRFEYKKNMRLTVYSGRDLTKFNPLLHKNGGYGSVQYAKEIDDRFTAHFCELNMYNLQLMGKTWTAKSHGSKSTISNQNGPILFESDAFVE